MPLTVCKLSRGVTVESGLNAVADLVWLPTRLLIVDPFENAIWVPPKFEMDVRFGGVLEVAMSIRWLGLKSLTIDCFKWAGRDCTLLLVIIGFL